jgi:pimeloyl-ACP methyl ester carboxylesterase
MNPVFRIVLFLGLMVALLSIPAPGQSVEVQTGEINGAPFRIQIPSQWNRNLVMYAHGYLPRGTPWSPLAEILCAAFLQRGFAVAESGYSRQGWAVAEAVEQTETLREHFVELHGEPDSTFVAGHSMGGLIALASAETYPASYAGALPMCSPLVPAIHFFRDPVFDMLVTFEALFGRFLPQELGPVIDLPDLPQQVIDSALQSDKALAARFAQHWDIRGEDVAAILTLYHLLYRELTDRAGGNPIDNRNTVYSGLGQGDTLNEMVPRYTSDPGALTYTRRHYTPTGEIEDPVLAVHTTYDPGVPPRLPSYYDVTVSLKGNQKWFVQKYVIADGHCNIEASLMGKAFDQLRTWAATGTRPEAGLLQ